MSDREKLQDDDFAEQLEIAKSLQQADLHVAVLKAQNKWLRAAITRAETAEAKLATAVARLELLTIRDGRILAVAGGDDYRQRLEKELADAYGKVKALEDALRRDRAYVSAGWELFP